MHDLFTTGWMRLHRCLDSNHHWYIHDHALPLQVCEDHIMTSGTTRSRELATRTRQTHGCLRDNLAYSDQILPAEPVPPSLPSWITHARSPSPRRDENNGVADSEPQDAKRRHKKTDEMGGKRTRSPGPMLQRAAPRAYDGGAATARDVCG